MLLRRCIPCSNIDPDPDKYYAEDPPEDPEDSEEGGSGATDNNGRPVKNEAGSGGEGDGPVGKGAGSGNELHEHQDEEDEDANGVGENFDVGNGGSVANVGVAKSAMTE